MSLSSWTPPPLIVEACRRMEATRPEGTCKLRFRFRIGSVSVQALPVSDPDFGPASGWSLCCSFAHGVVVEDPDWAIRSDDAKLDVHYRVRINGKWIESR
jgi:hypothetical protein